MKVSEKYKTMSDVIEKLLIHESYVVKDRQTEKLSLIIKEKDYKEVSVKVAKLFY
jgi:hypothetical protein